MWNLNLSFYTQRWGLCEGFPPVTCDDSNNYKKLSLPSCSRKSQSALETCAWVRFTGCVEYTREVNRMTLAASVGTAFISYHMSKLWTLGPTRFVVVQQLHPPSEGHTHTASKASHATDCDRQVQLLPKLPYLTLLSTLPVFFIFNYIAALCRSCNYFINCGFMPSKLQRSPNPSCAPLVARQLIFKGLPTSRLDNRVQFLGTLEYSLQKADGIVDDSGQRKFRSSNFRLYWKLPVALAASMFDSRDVLAGRNCAKCYVFP